MSFTSLILAFYWAPLLTLAIPFSLLILIIVQGFSRAIAGPRLAHERNLLTRAASFLSRAATNIVTLKASNAQSHGILTPRTYLCCTPSTFSYIERYRRGISVPSSQSPYLFRASGSARTSYLRERFNPKAS